MEVLHNKDKTVPVGNIGKIDEQTKDSKSAKFFLRDELGLTGMEASLNGFPANYTSGFFHAHKQNEELYIITKGEGEIQLDDDIFPIKEGSVIRVQPDVARSLRSAPNSALQFICIQAQAGSLQQCNKADGFRVEREFAKAK